MGKTTLRLMCHLCGESYFEEPGHSPADCMTKLQLIREAAIGHLVDVDLKLREWRKENRRL